MLIDHLKKYFAVYAATLLTSIFILASSVSAAYTYVSYNLGNGYTLFHQEVPPVFASQTVDDDHGFLYQTYEVDIPLYLTNANYSTADKVYLNGYLTFVNHLTLTDTSVRSFTVSNVSFDAANDKVNYSLNKSNNQTAIVMYFSDFTMQSNSNYGAYLGTLHYTIQMQLQGGQGEYYYLNYNSSFTGLSSSGLRSSLNPSGSSLFDTISGAIQDGLDLTQINDALTLINKKLAAAEVVDNNMINTLTTISSVVSDKLTSIETGINASLPVISSIESNLGQLFNTIKSWESLYLDKYNVSLNNLKYSYTLSYNSDVNRAPNIYVNEFYGTSVSLLNSTMKPISFICYDDEGNRLFAYQNLVSGATYTFTLPFGASFINVYSNTINLPNYGTLILTFDNISYLDVINKNIVSIKDFLQQNSSAAQQAANNIHDAGSSMNQLAQDINVAKPDANSVVNQVDTYMANFDASSVGSVMSFLDNQYIIMILGFVFCIGILSYILYGGQ